VLKIVSPDISHKSEVNGVRLNIGNAQAVRGAYHELLEAVERARPQAHVAGVSVEPMYRHAHARELHVGVARDTVFGPVISFGLGGIAIEVLHDHAIALPPLNNFIARSLIDRTRAAKLLGVFRNMPPADLVAVENVLLRVSEMVCELPQIAELDINPLAADPDRVVALDVRIVLDSQPPPLARYGHMAIHPYPTHLESRWQLADGTDIFIRPIRPEDAEIEAAFVRDLSPRAKYFRFMHTLRELSTEMLVRFTQLDYDRELALLAVVAEGGKEIEIAVARYGINRDAESCEFAIAVADAWQAKGIGQRLMTTLMEAAKARGIRLMEGEVLAENTAMLDLMLHLGFSSRTHPQSAEVVMVTKEL
jgi:acetyltransferase